MAVTDADMWKAYSQAYAFIGNTLLKPMNQTSSIGLIPEFWSNFPDFESSAVRAASDECKDFVSSSADAEDDKSIERVSVEYTRLFIGPPSPAVPPWETAYRSGDAHVGFGEATFEMRQLLREAGLRLQNENNQFEDHMGIELLYLSFLCRRIADSAPMIAKDGMVSLTDSARAFASDHPSSWIEEMGKHVERVCPDGYYCHILRIAQEVLRTFAE